MPLASSATHVESAKSTAPKRDDRWQAVLPGLILFLLVVAAYLPALHCQFIWDDDFYVLKDASLRSLKGLWHFWTQPGASEQYYPLTYSSFWVDYHLWGLNPLPYHSENILLHAVNVILVWRILRRLNVPGAWLGAALFALHPVCVESVAWVSERKNTLAGLFFLLSLQAAIEFWLPQTGVVGGKNETAAFGPRKFFWLSLLFYVCALWSKSVTMVLPGIILLLVWWKRGRLKWKDGLPLLPFLALGLVLGFITALLEHKFVVDAANGDEWQVSWPARFIIAGRNVWFYLGKLFWPHPLMFVYPRWETNAARPLAYLPLAAAIGVFAVLWFKRRTWTGPLLIAGCYFVIALFPALGFFNAYPFRYSFVADHFQYLAAIGPLALAAAGVTCLARRFPQGQVFKHCLAGAILLAFFVLAWRQCHVYQNLEVLWRDTLAHNPSAWMAEDNLGRYLTEAGRFDEADSHYRKAIEIRPEDHIAYYDLGLEAAVRGNLDDALGYFAKTLALCPNFPMAHYEVGNIWARQGMLDGAVSEYKTALKALPHLALGHFNLANALARQGKLDDAAAEYNQTLEEQPDYAPAYAALGRISAAKGKPDETIGYYRDALNIDPNSVEALANLANALVSKGQFDEAITDYRSALQFDPNSPVLHFDLSVALAKRGNIREADVERVTAQRLEAERPTGH